MYCSPSSRLCAVAFAVVIACALTACGQPTAPPATSVAPVDTAAATVATRPTILFLADDRRVVAGACTTLEWQTDGVIRTYLDGRGVAARGSGEVCPTQTTTYTLSVVLADGTETTRTQVVTVEDAALAAPTEAAAVAPTVAVAATRVPSTPAPTATSVATVIPTASVSVEFYPANNVYEIGKDDSCTAVEWKTTGVTTVQLEREGLGRKDVGATGREEVCFGGRNVKLYLYYKLPDGREERRELEIRRQS
jgi:hypothetical protein